MYKTESDYSKVKGDESKKKGLLSADRVAGAIEGGIKGAAGGPWTALGGAALGYLKGGAPNIDFKGKSDQEKARMKAAAKKKKALSSKLIPSIGKGATEGEVSEESDK